MTKTWWGFGVVLLLLSVNGCKKSHADTATKPAKPSMPAVPAPPSAAMRALNAARAQSGVLNGMRTDLKKLGNDFVSDVRDGHVKDAYALMATPYKEGVKLARFKKKVAKNPYLKNGKSFVLYKTSGSLHSVKATGQLNGKSGDVDVTMSCAKEKDGWKLNGFSIAGNPVVPAP